MKSKFMFLFMLMLLVPMVAFADMGAPIIRPFEVVVVAEDGIDYYSEYTVDVVAGHLDKGSKFVINNYYGSEGGNINFEIGNELYYLKSLDGTVVVQDAVKPEDVISGDGITIEKATEKNTVMVYADGGVDVRKGPSDVYDKVGHLDKGTIVKYSHSLSGGGITHVYINSNGIKGWIYLLNSAVLLENSNKYIVVEDVNTKCGVVTKNTILSPRYITDNWGRSILYEKDECSDFIYDNSVLKMSKEQFVANKELTLYEYAINGGEKLATIAAGTEFEAMGRFWYRPDDDNLLYLTYNGKTGWIKGSATDFTNKTDYENGDNTIRNDNPPVEVSESPSQGTTDTSEKSAMTPLETTLMYVVIGLALAVTALVIIILVNKNRNAKFVDNKKE